MSATETILLILMAAAGAFAAWVLRNKTKIDFLQILLSFTGAYLLAITVTHLVPEVFAHNNSSNTAYFILAGFFMQLLIVQFTRGIEHGHLHLHEAGSGGYVAGVVFGLTLHAFLEGVPLSGSDIGHDHAEHVYYAILIHKLPEAFSLATVLFFSLKKHSHAAIILLLFTLVTPAGAWAGHFLSERSAGHSINWLLAIVCGTFIHISTTIIFESSGKAHHISLYKFLAILLGTGLSLIGLLGT